VTGLYGEVFSAGAVIGPYVVEALAGQGGFASLYRARHEGTGQVVAVKVLRHALAGSLRMIERFQREAEALGRLAHPHIVQILDSSDLTDGRPYIAMEWLDGRDLGQELAARGPFEAREALAVMSEIGAALAAAHAAGVVHRDVKAQNVIAIPRGPWFTVKLVDFGIARLIAPEDTPFTRRTIVGTPSCMSPEQIRGESVDARTDVYAMGVLLYQLVVGRLPFDAADAMELEDKHLHAPPPRASARAAVSPEFDAVVQRAMAKDREHRHASATELVEALRVAVETRPGPSPARRPAVRTCPGIGLCIEVLTRGYDDEVAGDVEQRIAEIVELGHRTAHECGLVVVVETADMLLAVAPLAPSPAADQDDQGDQARRRAILQVALALGQRIRDSHAAGASALELSMGVSITVHVADIDIRAGAGREGIEGLEGLELRGGELLRLGQWQPRPPRPGIHASAAVVAGLEAELGAVRAAGDSAWYEIPQRSTS
jgi:serine/threonine-protein kinase